MELTGDRGPAALAAALVLVALVPLATAGTGDVPCTGSGPAGPRCPDLVVDGARLSPVVSEETFAATHCAVVEGLVDPGQRRLLRFTTTTVNLGPGDLVVGAPADHPDRFTPSSCHGHHHFDDYADHRLWTLEGYVAWTALRATHPDRPPRELLADHPAVADGMVAGAKQGFCLVDTHRVVALDLEPRYDDCSDQGLSAGWSDTYDLQLDGQWVDITGVAHGTYVLEVEVNPAHRIVEGTYANNAAALPLWL